MDTKNDITSTFNKAFFLGTYNANMFPGDLDAISPSLTPFATCICLFIIIYVVGKLERGMKSTCKNSTDTWIKNSVSFPYREEQQGPLPLKLLPVSAVIAGTIGLNKSMLNNS